MPWQLLWRNLLGHPVRAALTAGSVAVAVFLIVLLQAIRTGLVGSLDQAAANRILVQSAVSLYVDLPLSYQQKLAAVPGVERICKWQWFGGRNEQDKGGYFAQFAVDADQFLACYPEFVIDDGSREEFERTRTACLIGLDIAEQYGWRVGQTVPIRGTIFTRTDGQPWEFTIAGIYRSTKTAVDQQTMYFHYDYLRESLETGGAVGPQGVGVYMLRVAPGADPVQVMAAADALFANGPQRVQATTEAEFNRQFITMLGDVPGLLGLIGGAVLFAIFFAVLNTMLMAGRERTHDFGVLKALGFADGAATRLLVAEGILLCGAGALVGLGLAAASEGSLQKVLGARLPGFEFDTGTLQLGAGIALGVGLLAGLLPGWQAARLRPVAALREVG